MEFAKIAIGMTREKFGQPLVRHGAETICVGWLNSSSLSARDSVIIQQTGESEVATVA
jgi:hypothetical protein